MTGSELFDLFMASHVNPSEVALMDLDAISIKVRDERQRVPELAALMMTDREIGQAILDYARAQLPDERTMLMKILFEQRRQTGYLERINAVIQLWGVLLLLSILAYFLWSIFG
jgi:hypothetical protein